MPAYNFKPRFASMVESGAKRCTMRPQRKRPTRPGDILIMYTGMRTKNARNLGDHWCKSVTPITVADAGILVAGELVDPATADAVAVADGFADAYDLTEFMTALYGQTPIDLVKIEWDHLVVSTRELAYAPMRAYAPRDDRSNIPAGTLGRILDYTDTGNAWGDVVLTVEFLGFEPRSISHEYIRHVYAPDARWTNEA